MYHTNKNREGVNLAPYKTNYEQNFKDIDDLSHIFYLLFCQKSDFDKKKFYTFPKT